MRSNIGNVERGGAEVRDLFTIGFHAMNNALWRVAVPAETSSSLSSSSSFCIPEGYGLARNILSPPSCFSDRDKSTPCRRSRRRRRRRYPLSPPGHKRQEWEKFYWVSPILPLDLHTPHTPTYTHTSAIEP